MLVVGLTGGIATGKSTVSTIFKGHNIPVVDADVIARQVVEPGTPGLRKIVKAFGDEVLLPDGHLDRKKLGSIIFNDESKRRTLNGIVHPAVRWQMFRDVLKYWIKGEKWIVMDVPLLIEGGLWRYVAKVVVVYCSADIELQRLMNRDQSSREDALARLNSQLAITEKVSYADTIIDNSGSLSDLESQVISFITRTNRSSGGVHWLLSWLVPPYGLLAAMWSLLLRRRVEMNDVILYPSMASAHQVALTRPPHPSTSTNVQRPSRQSVPAFLQKLYEMVNDPKNSDLIRWSESGDSFLVLDHERFAREVLGRWFKHQNFSSFVRQLNMYGFHKVPHLQQGALKSEVDDFWNFANPNFHQDQPDLLCLIHRKKQQAQLEEGAGGNMDIRQGGGGGSNTVGESSSTGVPTSQAGQIVDVHQIVQGIAAIKRHQTLLSEQLNELKSNNQMLWEHSMAARARHQKQEDTINRIIRFLAGVLGNHPANTHHKDDVVVDSTKLNQAVVPMRNNTRLMIEDAPDPTGKVGIMEVEDEEEPDSLFHGQYDHSSLETPNSAPSPSPSVSQSEGGTNSENDYSSLFSLASPTDTLKTPVVMSSNTSRPPTSTLERTVTPSHLNNTPSFEPEPRLQQLFNNFTPEQITSLFNLVHNDNQLTFPNGYDFNPPLLTPPIPSTSQQSQSNQAPNDGFISFDSNSIHDSSSGSASTSTVNHLNPMGLQKQWKATEDVNNAVNAIDPKIQGLMDSLGLDPSLLKSNLTELSASANPSVSGTGLGSLGMGLGLNSGSQLQLGSGSLTPFDVPVLSSIDNTDSNSNPTNSSRKNEGSGSGSGSGLLSMDMDTSLNLDNMEGNDIGDDLAPPTNSNGDFNMDSFLNEYDGLNMDNLDSTAFFDDVDADVNTQSLTRNQGQSSGSGSGSGLGSLGDVNIGGSVNSIRFSPLGHSPITPIQQQQRSNNQNQSQNQGSSLNVAGSGTSQARTGQGPSGIGKKRKSDAINDLEGALGATSVNDSSTMTTTNDLTKMDNMFGGGRGTNANSMGSGNSQLTGGSGSTSSGLKAKRRRD